MGKKDETATSRPKLWTPSFVIIIAMTLFMFMVSQGTNTGTSVFIDSIGGTSSYVGMLGAVFTISSAISRIASGFIIDRFSRALIMLVGSVMLLIASLGPLFSVEPAAFIIWRIFQGIGFSLSTTASATASEDVLPEERLGEGIGYFGLGQSLAMCVGPSLALGLVATDHPTNLYLGLSACAFFAILCSILCRYERHPEKLPATSAYRVRWEAANKKEQAADGENPAIAQTADAPRDGEVGTASETPLEAAEHQSGAPYPEELIEQTELKKGFLSSIFEARALCGALPLALITPAFAFCIFYMGLFGTTLHYAFPGLFFFISAVSMIVIRLFSGAFMDRSLPINVLSAGVACGLVSMIGLLGCSLSWWGTAGEIVFYLAGIPYGIFFAIGMSINLTVAVKNSPPERWGAANALMLFAGDAGSAVAIFFLGMVNEAAGFPMTFSCVIGCIVVGYALGWWLYPARDKFKSKAKAAS